MKTLKRLGIWIDHSSAHLTEYTTVPAETKIIRSEFTHDDKEQGLNRSENQMHKKEQHQHSEYYKKIADVIRNYDDVILFGPTDAKIELLNILKQDHLFSKINIETKQTDKMSEHEQQAFIKEHFSDRDSSL
jgi:stalled ribosome rescue protein Dom34